MPQSIDPRLATVLATTTKIATDSHETPVTSSHIATILIAIASDAPACTAFMSLVRDAIGLNASYEAIKVGKVPQ